VNPHLVNLILSCLSLAGSSVSIFYLFKLKKGMR
jgi:hypothetical protein